MRWKTRIVAVVVMCLAWPAQAYACYVYKHLTYNPIPARISFGAGVQISPGGDDLGLIFSADGNIPFGSGKGVISPLIGLCTEGDFSEMLLGAAAAWQIQASGNNTINLQTGLTYMSYSGGDDMVIPLGASIAMKKSDKMSWFGGATILWNSFSFDGGPGVGDISESDTDPAVYAGAMLNQGALSWILGGAIIFGHDTDITLNVGVSTNPGTAGAIRRFASRLWK